MIKKDISERELYNRTMQFLGTNLESINAVNPNIVNYIKENWREQLNVDVLLEAYDEMDALDENNNVYDAFLGILKEKFDINQDIIEVGGGLFPALSKRIASSQTAGTITVYDPNLVLKKYPYENLVLKKENFQKNTHLGNAKLLVGISPCHSVDLILERASAEDLDFMVKVCPCELPFTTDYDYMIKAMFARYLIRKNKEFKQSGGPGFEVTYLDQKYNDNSPIIYTKKRLVNSHCTNNL